MWYFLLKYLTKPNVCGYNVQSIFWEVPGEKVAIIF